MEFLLKQNQSVIGVDSNRDLIQHLQTQGWHCQHDSEIIDWKEIVRLVVSPGISPEHQFYRTAKKQGIEITCETEMALPYFNKPLVAITGTNGKTTVTLLVEHILNATGIKAKALGNVGTPLCAELLEPSDSAAFVVELSSFQLETMRTPIFEAGVLLNVTPDHLDRYAGMKDYAQAKFRLQNVLKADAPLFIQKQTHEAFPHLIQKSFQVFAVDQKADLYLDQMNVYYREKFEFIMPKSYREMSKHDYENALAAWALCRPFAISNDQFCLALSTFRKPPHRIEFVREMNGVHFYDDSKGTNIDAVVQAVKAMKGPVILIVGGVDKGASYLAWKEPFSSCVKQIIAIGAAAPKIYSELHPYFNIKCADSLASAVEIAADLAVRGDYVLLSPGCSSYDMFRDYAHRGEEFQRQVQLIEGRRRS